MAITNRNLPPETVLVATFKKATYHCMVEADEDGRLSYALSDGRRFNSPSAAASALMGGKAANGWRFWSVLGAKPEATTDSTSPATKAAKPARKKAAITQIRRVPNQKNTPDGKARWFCSACMKSFFHDDGVTPETCPDGHPREIEDDLASPEGDVPPAA